MVCLDDGHIGVASLSLGSLFSILRLKTNIGPLLSLESSLASSWEAMLLSCVRLFI